MLKKTILILTGLFLLLPLSAQAQQMRSEYVFAKVYRAEQNPAKYKDPGKAKELLEKRRAIVSKLGSLKKKLVKENAELGKLQAEFDACLLKMGKTLAGKEAVRTIQNRIALLEKEAQTLPRTIADREKQLAAAKRGVISCLHTGLFFDTMVKEMEVDRYGQALFQVRRYGLQQNRSGADHQVQL